MAWRLIHCYKCYSQSHSTVKSYCNKSINTDGTDRYEIITASSIFYSLAKLNDRELCQDCLSELKKVNTDYQNMTVTAECQTQDFKIPSDRPAKGWSYKQIYKKAPILNPQLEMF